MDHTLLGGALALLVAMPLAWKWHLGLARVAGGIVLLCVIAGLLTTALGRVVVLTTVIAATIVWLATLALGFGVVAYFFYRNPERRPPARDDVVVSPADGEVIYVRESRAGSLPVSTKKGRNYELQELTKTPLSSSDAIVIGISMSFLDVHVNRAPITGTISAQRHFAGSFGSLRIPEMVFENERATTVVEGNHLQVAVVQIASRLVRQIDSFVREGDEVTLGDRIGVIRFGSQVDLVLPRREDLKIAVRPGDRTKAGESIVALLEPAPSPAAAAPTSAARD